MKKQPLMSAFIALFGLTALSAEAGLITYTNRALFNAAAPGLPVETFENNLRGTSGVEAFADPLNSATNNGIFATGTILPGIELSVIDPSAGGDLLVLLGAEFLGAGMPVTDAVGPNTFVDNLQIDFTGGANAVGLDIYGLIGAPQDLDVSFFNGGALLGTVTIAPGATSLFIGAINDMGSITRITTSSTDLGEIVDNIAFGTTGGSAPVPEPATLALIILGIAGIGFSRKRKAAHVNFNVRC